MQDEANPGGSVLVVSNRLPVRVRVERTRIELQPAAGGLATALRSVQGIRTWIGWSGGPVPEAMRERVTAQLAGSALTPVFLTADEERNYYAGMCNSTLWPLLHYFPGKTDTSDRSWTAYRAVNERFAAAVLAAARDDDVVWIHDFHLMLLPTLLRRARPSLRIGFFLHVPFPSSEVWRIVPQREELLRGLLGADYIGFHTADYLRHFRDSCLRVLGMETRPDRIRNGVHEVRLGVDALGPDVAAFQDVLARPEVDRHIAEYAARWGDRRVLLGVERLDYTKGVPHKLRAFARLLERYPERAADTVMLQVLVPSREENESYRMLLREIEREVGRINGRFGAPGRMPLEFLHRSVDSDELAALYRMAAACVVTPLRDGMNLVAHEFVLCQGHATRHAAASPGALVLSEFAGAALSLPQAIQVNPWDEDAVVAAMDSALTMPEIERAERMLDMHERVLEMDSARWAERFLEHLATAAMHNRETAIGQLDATNRAALVARFKAARRRILCLDYDGTLRELAQRPEQATPTPALRDLLRALAALPRTEVHVVSGRRRHTLESWLADLGLSLCAEHGFAARAPGGPWIEPIVPDLCWYDEVLTRFAAASDSLPGSFVERKPSGLAWHYRVADPGYGPWRARELQEDLGELLAHRPAEIVPGHAVLEVRAAGADKGTYVARATLGTGPDDFLLAAGDDRTDLDMFRALPPHGIAIHVGGGAPGATHAVPTPAALRELLLAFVDAAGGAA